MKRLIFSLFLFLGLDLQAMPESRVACFNAEGEKILSIVQQKTKGKFIASIFGAKIDRLKVIEKYHDGLLIFQFKAVRKTRAESSWVVTKFEGVLGLSLTYPQNSTLTASRSYTYCSLQADGPMGACYDPMTPESRATSKTSAVRCELLPL